MRVAALRESERARAPALGLPSRIATARTPARVSLGLVAGAAVLRGAAT